LRIADCSNRAWDEGLDPVSWISQSAIRNPQSAIGVVFLAAVVIAGGVELVQAGQGHAEPSGTRAGGLQVAGAPREIRQGDVFLLEVRAPEPLQSLSGSFGRREVAFWPGDGDRAVYRALVAADLEDAPGPAELLLQGHTAPGGVLRGRLVVPVQSASFPVQRLTVPRPFAELDPPTLARVQRERQRMGEALGELTPRRLWKGPFRVPLDDPPAPHGFGARRIINGEARAPHNGADFAVPAGTPVRAAQDGTVVLAEEHFVPGKAVVIDHGLKLFTMYFHLQETRVREGEGVRAGQVIGSVGASGRVTGAHLHWAARLNGARIDPTALVRVLRNADQRGMTNDQ
jgi:murein DD-endopeptidase MepM/ murein hydrolase activator NlpD